MLSTIQIGACELSLFSSLGGSGRNGRSNPCGEEWSGRYVCDGDFDYSSY